LLLILFNIYGQYITKEALEGFGDFRIGGQVIRNAKYAEKLPLIAKEETDLQPNLSWTMLWNANECGGKTQ
jgi:hypothetical protein